MGTFDITFYAVIGLLILTFVAVSALILKYIDDKVLAYVIIGVLAASAGISGFFYYVFTGCMTTNVICLGLIYHTSLLL